MIPWIVWPLGVLIAGKVAYVLWPSSGPKASFRLIPGEVYGLNVFARPNVTDSKAITSLVQAIGGKVKPLFSVTRIQALPIKKTVNEAQWLVYAKVNKFPGDPASFSLPVTTKDIRIPSVFEVPQKKAA